MYLVLVSGEIGVGKSALLKNKNFLKRFIHPIKVISTDIIGKKMYTSYSTKYFFFKNSYLRKFIYNSDQINISLLKKYLYFSSMYQKEKYWKFLESLLHPQIFQNVLCIIKNYTNKKGTLIFECAIPQKIFPQSLQKKFFHIHLNASQHKILKLINYRRMKVQEIFTILNLQKII